jgi:hypothetical protein
MYFNCMFLKGMCANIDIAHSCKNSLLSYLYHTHTRGSPRKKALRIILLPKLVTVQSWMLLLVRQIFCIISLTDT